MDKKVVFLDIDGTIVDFFGNIPESTKKPLEKQEKMDITWLSAQVEVNSR